MAALSLFGRSNRPILVIPTISGTVGRRFPMSRLLARTDGLAAHSARLISRDTERFAFPAERTVLLPPGVHIYEGPVADVRASLGIAPDELVIGVIGVKLGPGDTDRILAASTIARPHETR